jgi:hypothetical protein
MTYPADVSLAGPRSHARQGDRLARHKGGLAVHHAGVASRRAGRTLSAVIARRLAPRFGVVGQRGWSSLRAGAKISRQGV